MTNEQIDVLAVMDDAVAELRRGDGWGAGDFSVAADRLDQARYAVIELIEAVCTFVAWLDREEAGSGVGHLRDSSPEAEAQWREWHDENIRLCALAQSQGRAALARVQGGAA